MSVEPKSELERAAEQERAYSAWREIGEFLWVNKSFWLVPVVLLLGLLAMFIVLGGGAGAPFIYTLF